MESLFPAALRHITTAIETELLVEAFGKAENNPFAIVKVPLTTHIEREVIVNQVVKDIQLFDSRETAITLDGLSVVPVSEDYGTVFIPEHRRGGRDIMSVRGITHGTSHHIIGVGSNQSLGSNLSTAGLGVLNGLNRALPDTEHDVELVAPNTILLNTRFNTINMAMLHCNLTVDDKLSHIRSSTSLPFIELCIWKTKQLIYNRLNIAMGRDKIHQGKELGPFADAVREFRDARETYMELLADFRVTVKLTDPIARKRMIRQRLPKLLG